MKAKSHYLLTTLALLLPLAAHALTLPNYAQGGDLASTLQTKGKAVTDILALVATIVSIIGIVVGAIKIGGGDPDGGKRWVVSGILGLVIAGSVYGIAALVV